jgi:hypothetical protein
MADCCRMSWTLARASRSERPHLAAERRHSACVGHVKSTASRESPHLALLPGSRATPRPRRPIGDARLTPGGNWPGSTHARSNPRRASRGGLRDEAGTESRARARSTGTQRSCGEFAHRRDGCGRSSPGPCRAGAPAVDVASGWSNEMKPHGVRRNHDWPTDGAPLSNSWFRGAGVAPR